MKKYKVERRSIVGVAFEHYPNTIKSLGALIACSAAGPIAYIQVYNSDLVMNSMYSDICLGGTLLFFLFSAGYIGSKVYENFKEERSRVQELIRELDNERRIKKMIENGEFISPEQISDMRIQREYSDKKEVIDIENYLDIDENQSETLGKRKKLVTFPFKNNNEF